MSTKTRILLVDDEKVNLITGKSIIEGAIDNIICDTAQSGNQAIEKFKEKENRYHIIVLDMLMPEPDGFQTAEEITKYCTKNNISLPHMISYTVLDTNEIQNQAVKCGIIDYVAKGNRSALIKIIEKWVPVSRKRDIRIK